LIFNAGMRAVELFSASICTRILRSSHDYGAIERALAPAFAAGGPPLRSVELIFSDGPAPRGESPLEPFGHLASDDVGVGDGGQSAWFPTYHLVFRTIFPGGKLNVVGRVAVEVGELSQSRLQDEAMGELGRVFVADSGGYLLAAPDANELVQVEGSVEENKRIPIMRRLYELPPSWASSVRKAFPYSYPTTPPPPSLTVTSRPPWVQPAPSTKTALDIGDNDLVFVSPFAAVDLSHFAVVLMAPELSPFTDGVLFAIGITAFAFAAFPFFTLFIASFGLCLRHFYRLTVNPYLDPSGSQKLGRRSFIDRVTGGRKSRISAIMKGRFSMLGDGGTNDDPE